MDDKKNWGLGGICIFIILCMWIHINTLNKKIQARENMIDSCSSTIDNANHKIDDAHDSILNANDIIENASQEAWSDYDTMGQTLESMEQVPDVENVSNDCSVSAINDN